MTETCDQIITSKTYKQKHTHKNSGTQNVHTILWLCKQVKIIFPYKSINKYHLYRYSWIYDLMYATLCSFRDCRWSLLCWSDGIPISAAKLNKYYSAIWYRIYRGDTKGFWLPRRIENLPAAVNGWQCNILSHPNTRVTSDMCVVYVYVNVCWLLVTGGPSYCSLRLLNKADFHRF